MSELRIVPLVGAAIAPYLTELARLRIGVFREWPYLYAGSLEHEERYLARFTSSERALLVLALDGDRVVGASTALPLVDETDEVRAPFTEAALPIERVLYLGESVLESAHRGRGVGSRFFVEREAHAARLGLAVTTFCAVERAETHPARPSTYVPLHEFWQRRGYTRRPELCAHFTWLDVGDAEPTPKPLVFWLKGALP